MTGKLKETFMLEIQYAALYIPSFIPAIQKLSKARGIPAKTAYRLGKITKVILREYTKLDTKRLGIMREHLEKDEAGEWKKNEAGDLAFADRDGMKAKIEALIAGSFKIEQMPIPLEHLDSANLSPEEIAELDFMLVKEEFPLQA